MLKKSGKLRAAAPPPAAGSPAARRPDPAKVRQVFVRLRAANPEPRGELDYRNPYTLLVAVVLSAQSTDAGVNRATRPLFAHVDSPEAMLAFGEERLRDAIRTIGLFNTKARNIVALSDVLMRQHGGAVPRDRASLEALPGVGRKTANVVLNTAFGAPTIAVDTHVLRVSNRIPIAPGRNPAEVETGLEAIVPAEFKLHAHHWLILHGRYVCLARKPLCSACIVADLCTFPDKPAPT